MMREIYTHALTQLGYVVTTVANGQEAWEVLQRRDFDMLITDKEMPKLDGAELVLRMRSAGMSQPILVASSNPAFFNEDASQSLRVSVLQKPFGLGELTDTVSRLLQPKNNILNKLDEIRDSDGVATPACSGGSEDDLACLSE